MNDHTAQAADLPNDEAHTRYMLGSVARVRLLRHIIDNPGHTPPELAAATGYSQTAVRTAVIELENAGYISRDDDRLQPSKRSSRYTANRDVIEHALRGLTAWLLP
jgi:DNA-binding MarR family transcriptional regulator